MAKAKHKKRKRSGAFSRPNPSLVSELPHELVGRLVLSGRRSRVIPLLADLKDEVEVGAALGYADGDPVVVGSLASKYGKLRGELKHKIKGSSTAELAAKAWLKAYGVPSSWPKAVNTSKRIESVTKSDTQNRVDLRSMPLVTIDGATAKDFDDAVFASRKKNGNWRLVVAIADVAHYVTAGSEIDKTAEERACSIYLPDRVIPMLPEWLSNGICSLRPNEDRLALVCDMEVSKRGDLLVTKLYEAVIRSHARLTYGQVDDFLNGKPLQQSDSVKNSLRVLQEVALILIEQRQLRGALEIDLPAPIVHLENGEPMYVFESVRNFAHSLIEEAMILANQAVALFLKDKTMPIYRVHEPPLVESIEQLRKRFDAQGLKIEFDGDDSRSINQVLKKLSLSPSDSKFWHLQVIQTMQLACYSTANDGHFGLALSHYLHFTSPIRRYPDLYIHRLVKALLNGSQVVTDPEHVQLLANQLSDTEQQVDRISRRVTTWLLCKLLEAHVGERATGRITGIADFGLFVELDEYYVSGLVHVSGLGTDWFNLEDECLVGEASGERYAIGDRLRVRIAEVDPVLGRVDLRFERRQAKKRKR